MGVSAAITGGTKKRWSTSFALLFCLGASACASRNDDLQREIARLQSELTSVRAEQAASRQRLEAMQRERPPTETLSLDPDRSRLRVVRIAPPDIEIDAPGSTSGGRTRIHGSKTALEVDDVTDTARAEEAREAFSRAESLLTEKKYPPALAALTSFLVEYPDDPRAERATLLRGECLLATGDASRALDQFNAVLSAWPKSPSVPAALRGVASAHDRLGHRDEAERARTRLKKEFPKELKPQS